MPRESEQHPQYLRGIGDLHEGFQESAQRVRGGYISWLSFGRCPDSSRTSDQNNRALPGPPPVHGESYMEGKSATLAQRSSHMLKNGIRG